MAEFGQCTFQSFSVEALFVTHGLFSATHKGYAFNMKAASSRGFISDGHSRSALPPGREHGIQALMSRAICDLDPRPFR